MLSGVYRFPLMESVVFGKPYADALAEEVDRLDARAVFILASGTLSRETDLVDRLRQALGNRFAGLYAKIGAHTPRTDVMAAANMAREARRRSNRHIRRRLGHRCGEDGRAVPR